MCMYRSCIYTFLDNFKYCLIIIITSLYKFKSNYGGMTLSEIYIKHYSTVKVNIGPWGPEPGGWGRQPPDFGKNMDLFDFVIMNLTLFGFHPPPPILKFSGPMHWSMNLSIVA